MTTPVPTLGDIQAASDVANLIAELSDSMSVDAAVEYRVALVAHQAKVKFAIDMLDTQLVKTLELPRTVGGWVHQVRRKKETVRFDHEAIARVVREEAVRDKEGMLVGPREAAEKAVVLMSDIYLSPSSKAKIGALKDLEIDRKDVESFERGDLYVDVVPVMSEVQE